MRKRTRVILAVLLGLALLVILALFLLYKATQHVPEEYRAAMEIDPVRQREGSDEMLRQAGALAGDLKKEGRWEVLFTAEQINGWLAVDMVEYHPDLLPEGFSDPRVVITPDCIMLFGRIDQDGRRSVVSLTVEPYLPEPNVLAVRIRDARAGLVPLPLGDVLEALSDSAIRGGFDIHWQQAEGDPVALISILSTLDNDGRTVSIDDLRLDNGEIFLSGTVE
jgi:hypothetical protein